MSQQQERDSTSDCGGSARVEALLAAGWQAAIDCHTAWGMAGWSSHKEQYLCAAPVEHNGRLIINRGAGHYRIADFTGRYVDVPGVDAAAALRHFIDSKTCNYDTPYALVTAWRAAGCPTRAEWVAKATDLIRLAHQEAA